MSNLMWSFIYITTIATIRCVVSTELILFLQYHPTFIAVFYRNHCPDTFGLNNCVLQSRRYGFLEKIIAEKICFLRVYHQQYKK